MSEARMIWPNVYPPLDWFTREVSPEPFGMPLSPLRFFSFDQPDEVIAPLLDGGPWAAADTLRAPFVPWKRKS